MKVVVKVSPERDKVCGMGRYFETSDIDGWVTMIKRALDYFNFSIVTTTLKHSMDLKFIVEASSHQLLRYRIVVKSDSYALHAFNYVPRGDKDTITNMKAGADSGRTIGIDSFDERNATAISGELGARPETERVYVGTGFDHRWRRLIYR